MWLGGGRAWWLSGLVSIVLLVSACASAKGGVPGEAKTWTPCEPSQRANGTVICYQR